MRSRSINWKERLIPTEDDVDTEIVSADEPGNAFDLMRLQRRRDPEVGGVEKRGALGAAVGGEDELDRGHEPLLVLHRRESGVWGSEQFFFLNWMNWGKRERGLGKVNFEPKARRPEKVTSCGSLKYDMCNCRLRQLFVCFDSLDVNGPGTDSLMYPNRFKPNKFTHSLFI